MAAQVVPLIPLVGGLMTGRAWRRETNLLVGLRSMFLRILISLFLFLWAFSYVAPWDGGDEKWVPWAIAATGVYALVAMAWVRRRPLVTGSPEALAGSYRASFYMGLGLAQSPAPFGLAGVFIGDSLWIYLVGLAFTLVALWMIAPTRQDIERRQREITAAGSPLSLLDALTPFHRHKGKVESARPTPDRLRGGSHPSGGAGRDVAGGPAVTARTHCRQLGGSASISLREVRMESWPSSSDSLGCA